ncbi:MAG: hypothetical protein HY914_17625 [Desulfomonile tiedjei]|nr:hypothetical protein [Desulfomonile tiedjei]
MKTRDMHARVVSEAAGSAAMICWLLIVGPVGALIMLVVAYAMVLGNTVWIAACVLLLLSPLALTLAWGILAWPALLKRDEAEEHKVLTPFARPWPQRGHSLAGQRSLK